MDIYLQFTNRTMGYQDGGVANYDEAKNVLTVTADQAGTYGGTFEIRF